MRRQHHGARIPGHGFCWYDCKCIIKSANAQLPGWFRPWIFCLNNGWNIVPSCSFLSLFTFSTKIYYRGVSGFATDCPCGVWCHGLTTSLLYVSPFLEILFRMIAGLYIWHYGKRFFVVFIVLYICVNAWQYDSTKISFTWFPCLKMCFFLYRVLQYTNSHRPSFNTFYQISSV